MAWHQSMWSLQKLLIFPWLELSIFCFSETLGGLGFGLFCRGLCREGCFPGGSDCKESACNAGDLGLIPRSGKSPGEGNGYPLQYSCLENHMDRGSWWATVHGIIKSQTWQRWLSMHACAWGLCREWLRYTQQAMLQTGSSCKSSL